MNRLLLLFAASATIAGCHWDLHDPGTEPQVTQFYFPSGIAYDTVDRGGGLTDRYLYVTNFNADLRYGGGLVQLVDVRRFDCAVGRYCDPTSPANLARAMSDMMAPATPCPTEADGKTPVLKMEASCDVALADQDLAFPADPLANPSLTQEPECQPDPLDPGVIDCDETPFIVSNAGVRVGNFAGSIRVLHPSPSPDPTRRLFTAVRGDPSITYIDVNLGKLVTGQQPTLAPPLVFNCFDHPELVAARPGYDAADNKVIHSAGCDVSHVVGAFQCTEKFESDCTQLTTNLPTEPFGMRIDTGVFPDGNAYSHLLVSHLTTGQVTLIDAENAPGSIVDVSQPFFTGNAAGQHGAFSLAPQYAHDPNSPWYMTSNLQPIISTFRVAEANVVVPSISFNIGGAFATGEDVRDIEFEPGGNRAFLTENDPPSVLVVDTRVTDGRNPGQPLNQLVDIIDVCQTPSHMASRRTLVNGAPGTPVQLRTDLYVVCFLSSQLMVVDPDAPDVQDTILTGRGPNDITFNFGDVGDPDAPPAPPARRAWVTQFSEMTIGEIDLDPGSPTQNRLVARLGKPVPPPKQ